MSHWKVSEMCFVQNRRHMTCWMRHYLSGSVRNILKNVKTNYIKTEKPVQILRRTDLMWFCSAKNKSWYSFLKKTLAKTGSRHTHTYTVHMFTHSHRHFLEWWTDSAQLKAKSWEGYLTWQSMLRQFSNTVEQQSSIVLYSLQLYCAALFHSQTTLHLYKLKIFLQSKTKNEALKGKTRKEVSSITLNPHLQSRFAVHTKAHWWIMCGGCELRGSATSMQSPQSRFCDAAGLNAHARPGRRRREGMGKVALWSREESVCMPIVLL